MSHKDQRTTTKSTERTVADHGSPQELQNLNQEKFPSLVIWLYYLREVTPTAATSLVNEGTEVRDLAVRANIIGPEEAAR